MNSKKTDERINPKVFLSTLWVFALVNYIYCDVISIMNPEDIKNIISGNVGVIHITPAFLLGASILMEIPMAMILFSRILNFGINRWMNIISGIIMTAVQISSLFTGTKPTPHYIFFSAIEIASTLFIIWYAWRWRKTGENQIS